MNIPDWSTFIAQVAACATAQELDALEHALFGRHSGTMTAALRSLGAIDAAQRKTAGQELNAWKQKIESAIGERRKALLASAMDRLATDDRIDVTLSLPEKPRGHAHPLTAFIRHAEDIFGAMGFDVAEGPELETDRHNFDLLNFPKDHPARDTMDTFFVQDYDPNDTITRPRSGEFQWLLRCHTSPVQVRYMQSHTPPFRMICPGRVYRKDSDATHSPMFHQIEGLMIGDDVSLANMKAVMSTAMRALLGDDLVFRFRTSFFPFVEPGLEVDMKFKGTDRWLEVAGCGMVHPRVLESVGIDPDKHQGFAFGFGVERLVMIREGITDLRQFYSGDPRFLEQF